LANALRAVLYEYGQVIPQGIGHIKRIEAILDNTVIGLPEIVQEECRDLLAQIGEKTARIEEKARRLTELSPAKRSRASASDHAGCGAVDRAGRRSFRAGDVELPMRPGLCRLARPRSTTVLFWWERNAWPVSKAGQADIRRLLIIGAMARLSRAGRKPPVQGSWLSRMLTKKPRMLVAIALANKMARTIWAMLTKQEDYRDPALAMAA
jgi:transposase